jgi:hypothetical protein
MNFSLLFPYASELVLNFPLLLFFVLFVPVFIRLIRHRNRYASLAGRKQGQKSLKNSGGGKIKTSS